MLDRFLGEAPNVTPAGAKRRAGVHLPACRQVEMAGVGPRIGVRGDEWFWRRQTCEAIPAKAGACDNREIQTGLGSMMYKYGIVLYWSSEDGVFVAEAPQLPGCMAHGATQEAALREINEAIRLWIDTSRELGNPVPEPEDGRSMVAQA